MNYRLGLFPLTSNSLPGADLFHGHWSDDPVLDNVGDSALVTGHSVHVMVDPGSGKPTTISSEWRRKFETLKPKL